ncbi:5-formyltetrahydrofolate cyclo-ligase [Lysinibacillus sp. KU-BSD001]|uniref:5-formyltetrahydrofolate cyclo-ligase n=1 Tax=Lysinibacillus sp. KU-BSD001 TaxID=3141328 RepID=UPI0036E94707
MDKKILRNEMRRRLKQMDEATYLHRSRLIQQRLLREPSIVEGKTIAVTMSRFPEVETREIIQALWQLGKTVAVPKCQSQTHEMEFYRIDNFNQLEIVYFGIEEPILTQTNYISKREIDVIIVPGIVFNKAGYRVGFGGGYYDRYLVDYLGEKISLAFDEQVTEQVPTESHDMPVNIILTDKQRILARKSEE